LFSLRWCGSHISGVGRARRIPDELKSGWESGSVEERESERIRAKDLLERGGEDGSERNPNYTICQGDARDCHIQLLKAMVAECS
jgi:hypothetical protein